MRFVLSAAPLVLVVAVGCADDRVGLPGVGAAPETTQSTGGHVEIGFKLGRLRSTAEVAPFRITTSPVTNEEYARCVGAGRCTAPAMGGAACDARRVRRRVEAPNAPVTCVEPDQASGFCAWVGMRLPTDAEWLLAARGPAVRRFAWGDEPASCDQHPLGSPPPEARTVGCERVGVEVADDVDEAKRHPAGASPSGIQDILLTAGELVAGGSQSALTACRADAVMCVFGGLLPGAIDAVAAVPWRTSGVAAGSPPPFGFRCAAGGT